MSAPENSDGNTALLSDLNHVVAAAISGTLPPERPAWEQLLPLLARHQVDAWLFEIAATWPTPLQPDPPTMASWSANQRRRVVTAVRRQAQLAQILAALQTAGIPVIPLKGAWLAEHVYDDIAQRPMSDHDLLIQPDHAAHARTVLESLGYVAPAEATPAGWGKEASFTHPQWPHGLELHWTIWHATHHLPRQEMARLWQSATPDTVAGVPVMTLSPATHLAYLAYHIQAHQWRVAIRSHLDIVLACRRLSANLTTADLIAAAAAWQLPFSIPFGWRVAHAICSATLPPLLPAPQPLEADEAAQTEKLCQITWNITALPPKMPRLLGRFHEAPWHRRALIALQAALPSAPKIRSAHPLAVRRAGLVGGYAARAVDLCRRRWQEITPKAAHNATLQASRADLAKRQALEKWLRNGDQNRQT